MDRVMPACCVGRLALWPLLLISSVVMLCMTALADGFSDLFIFHSCGFVTFLIWIILNTVILMRSHQEERDHNNSTNDEDEDDTRPHNNNNNVEGFRGYLSFGRRAQIARLAIKALPPVKSFKGEDDETDGSKNVDYCAICLEEFKDGELIQPFGLCVHEFHSSCINSWLHSGKTTCPLCRKDLAASINASGT